MADSDQKPPAWSLPADIRELDPLHPTGRCTCYGEGRCAWCQEICSSCMGDGHVPGNPTIECDYCCGTGYADGLPLTAEERAAKIEAIRSTLSEPTCSCCGGVEAVTRGVFGWLCDFCYYGDTLPDYEARGYPETEFWTVDLDAYHVVAGNIVTMAGYWAGAYGDALYEKDIRDATDNG